MPSLPDIQTEADVRRVVDAFYGRIDEDELLGPFFEGVDWPAHLPKMTRFWCSVVFQTGTYRGRPFDAHLGLEGLAARHFLRWVDRFVGVVDTRFAGPNAERMKGRAVQIAGIFRVKLGLWHEQAV